MRPPLCGTMITCLTFCRSPAAVVVANSTRRRISRSTTRISTIANVAPRQRRLPPPNGNHVSGSTSHPHPVRVEPVRIRGISRNCCAQANSGLPPSPRRATDSQPTRPVLSAPGPRRTPPAGCAASPWPPRRGTRRRPHPPHRPRAAPWPAPRGEGQPLQRHDSPSRWCRDGHQERHQLIPQLAVGHRVPSSSAERTNMATRRCAHRGGIGAALGDLGIQQPVGLVDAPQQRPPGPAPLQIGASRWPATPTDHVEQLRMTARSAASRAGSVAPITSADHLERDLGHLRRHRERLSHRPTGDVRRRDVGISSACRATASR